jgi:hypothetical protein
MRECGHCDGTGQIPCSDEESEGSRDGTATEVRKVVRTRVGSIGSEKWVRRASDGKRSEGGGLERRDGMTKARVDKGKGKARVADEVCLTTHDN